MKQAIIYARFSPRPNAEDCTSCEFQIDKCRAFCEARSFDVVAVYQDAGLSGKDIKHRPEFQKALYHVCNIHGVLVAYHLTRLSRSIHDAIHLCDLLEQKHADFAIVTQTFDTTTPMGRYVFYNMAALGQLYREETAHRTREHLKRMRELGFRTSFIPPFGWALDLEEFSRRVITDQAKIKPYKLIAVSSEQVIVRALIAWRREGKAMRQIVKLLAEAGHKPRRGRWHCSMVKRILNRAGLK